MRFRANLTEDHARRRFYVELWPQAATVVRSARLLTRDAAEADDLVQETMLKAFESLERFQPGSNAAAWLLTILRHAWIDRVRARNARPTVALNEADVPDTASHEAEDVWQDPEDILFRFADSEVIDALHALPDEIRWTLLLVDVQGLPLTEAAEVLDVPPGTIKSRAHRGRAMLRETLLPRAQELGFVERRPTERKEAR